MRQTDDDRDILISNHRVADGTEDVVLQNVDQTISNDLTEERNELRQRNVQTEHPDETSNHQFGDDSDTRSEIASESSGFVPDARERMHGLDDSKECERSPHALQADSLLTLSSAGTFAQG